MYKILTYIILIFLLVTSSVWAQKFELGSVTKEELAEKFHPADTTAPAAVLYEKGRVYFEYRGYFWVVVTEVETRIKIYNKEGYVYAQHELYYYTGDSSENMFSDVCTYNLEGESIVKTKLGTEGEFVEARNKYTEVKKIILPDVKEGSIVEYKYKTATSALSYLPDWYFSNYIPVNYTEYSVALPACFSYHSIISGDLKIKRTPQATGFRNGIEENRMIYSATNVPALKLEPYVDNIDNYRPLIKHEMAASMKFNGERSEYTTSWKSLAQKIYNDEDFGEQLTFQSYFKKDIDAILTPNMGMEEKASAIFKYVQSRMTWNEKGGYVCRNGVKKAYQSKLGNVAEINLMLISMLRYAHIVANPVLTSTRSNGVPSYPSFYAFNYVIASIEIAGKTILMDATSKYSVPGILPPRTLNRIGRLIKQDGTADEIDLVPKKSSKSIYKILASVTADGVISGEVRNQYFNYHAFALREVSLSDKKEEYITLLEKGLEGSEIANYAVKDGDKNAVTEEYFFDNKNIVDKTGGKLMFNPMLFYSDNENPFTANERLYPIDFMYPYQYKYMITLNLPEGYKVESSPEPSSIVMGENIASFKYMIGVLDNQVQLIVIFEVNHAIIAKENYIPLKDFFAKMIEKQNEKIILKKS